MNKPFRDIDEDRHEPGTAAALPSPVAACDAAFRRIAQSNDEIGALTDVLRITAVQEARRAEARLAGGVGAGRVEGWPIAIKDNIDTVPARCSAGLAHLMDHHPLHDADVVSRLREEGAVIVGAAYTDSGAFGVTSPGVRNPRFPELITGGSSGGSAAAVAAGYCVAAIGTDTGGSVRIPATCCGVVGFKPSKGRVSTLGVRPLAESCDHVGVLAESVPQARQVFEVIDARPPTLLGAHPWPAEKLVIGLPAAFYADADEPVKAMMARTVERLERQGAVVRTVDIGEPDDIVEAHVVLALTEAALAYQEGDARHAWNLFPQLVQQSIDLGCSYTSIDHLRAQRTKERFTRRVDEVLRKIDLMLLPVLPIVPPPRDAQTAKLGGQDVPVLHALIRYTSAFNQSGHPVVALPVPCGDGAPGGVQLVGRLGGDGPLLRSAERVEAWLR